MPLELPILDDRRYEDLVAEARRLIPVYDTRGEWTNHNPSDPGIACIELFAYLTEMLLYRLDRVTTENQRKFLKLLNGPDWTPGDDLNADIRSTVRAVRARERAVTAADFERLATDGFNRWLAALQRVEERAESLEDWWRITALDAADAANLPSAVPGVARAACVPSRNLDRGTEAERSAFAPGHVSVMVVPRQADALQPPAAQRAALWGYLDERRTLTTRHHVVGPHYAPIGAEIVIASIRGAEIPAVRDRVVAEMAAFLSPRGESGNGWPFGRDVYISELYERLEAVDGVDYITDLMLFSACLPSDVQCVEAAPVWHAEGDLIGLALQPHHLPLARVTPDAVVVVPNTDIVRAQLTVTLTANPGADLAMLKRLVKRAVRAFVHPLHDGPGPETDVSTTLQLAQVKAALESLAGVAVAALVLQADTSRLVTENGQVTGLRVEPGEVVSMRTRITLEEA